MTHIKDPEIPRTSTHQVHRSISMSRQRIGFDIRCSVLKGHHTALDQLLNLILQRITIFNVMAGSSLLKSTVKIWLEPPWKRFRNLWRISWLNRILDNQGRIQLCISHWNRVKRDLLPLKILMMIVVVVVVGTLLWLLLNRN
jgi:hypothetical protein